MRTQFINALMRIRFPCALQKLKRAPFFCSRFERHLKSSREKSEEKNEYQEILHCVHISLDRFLSHSLSAFGVSVHFICLIFIIFVDVQVALKCMFPHTHTQQQHICCCCWYCGRCVFSISLTANALVYMHGIAIINVSHFNSNNKWKWNTFIL